MHEYYPHKGVSLGLPENSTPRERLLRRVIDADLVHEEENNPQLRDAVDFDFSTIPEPLPGSKFDARIDLDKLTKAFPEEDPKSLLLYGAMVSGIKLGDPEAGKWARLPKEYSPQSSHFYVTGEFAAEPSTPTGRRLSLRVIPEHWEDPRFNTQFTVRSIDSQLELSFKPDEDTAEIVLGRFRRLLPADAPRLAYRREGRHDGDNGVVINPIMTCPHRCTFCSRQYDVLNRGVDREDKTALAVLDPEEIVAHMMAKWPGMDWTSIDRLSVVTGSFNNFDHMHEYIEGLSMSLAKATDGTFQTGPMGDKEILVLTHLARERKHFQTLKSLGVALQDTVEILDDDLRRTAMPRASRRAVPKYEFSQEEILASIPDAIDVLGERDYRTTIILGIDDLTTTINGLRRMRGSGLKRFYYPTYQPYGYANHDLYGMDLVELLTARAQAKTSFSQVY